jgi:hypothetical protein
VQEHASLSNHNKQNYQSPETLNIAVGADKDN